MGFDPERLQAGLPFFRDLDPAAGGELWVHYKRDNLEGYVQRLGTVVRVAFSEAEDNLHRLEDPKRPAGSRVQVASLVDLAGMKLRVIQVRGNWKEYVDIHALASHGIDIPAGLAAARAIGRSGRRSVCVPCSIRGMAHWADAQPVLTKCRDTIAALCRWM
jgi:hypothetical protein